VIRAMGFLTVAMMAASGARAQGIALVPVFGLPGAAQADAKQRVVFYDPQQIRQIGPDMAEFVIAHEEAHVRFGHAAPEGDVPADSTQIIADESAADCQAAAKMVTAGTGSIDAVIRFFERVVPLRPDDDHPTGDTRAAVIRSCAATARKRGRSA